MTRVLRIIIAVGTCASIAAEATAQSASTPGSPYRPLGRIALFSTFSRTTSTTGERWTEGAFNTSLTLRPATDGKRTSDYGLDLRHTVFSPGVRSSRTSIYEAFAGTSVLDESLRVRGGHIWLNDLGALGSVAGGQVEYRRPGEGAEGEGLWFGAFGGLEPDIMDVGYASNVKKFGGYVTYAGEAAQRNTAGYVMIRDAGMTERSVLTTTNFVPIGKQLFLYQAAEYDVSAPAGRAENGLTYLFTSTHFAPSDRIDFHGTYQRGRSIDARGLVEELSSGRPVSQAALTGLLYESVGGRATLNVPQTVVGSLNVFAGYFKDRNDEKDPRVSRTLIGGQLSNVRGSGVDLMVSDSRIQQPSGTHHSTYVSIGGQLNDQIYVAGDYSTSLSVIRFTRSSGIVVETRPRTVRWSGTVNGNLTRTLGLLIVAERTTDEAYNDVRVLSGLTYRIR